MKRVAQVGSIRGVANRKGFGFSFKLVGDQSLIGSGIASVRMKLPRL